MTIAILGTDGSGKSTIISELKKEINNISYFHLRPRFFSNISQIGKPEAENHVVEDPHAAKPHRFPKSIISFFYYLLDYTLGYFINIFIKKKDNLVVFDRYYYDYFVDKKRFRTSLSDRWFSFWELFIPKPKYVFYLDGTPELFLSRKREVSKEELILQIAKFRKLCEERSHFTLLDASQSPKDICKSIINIIGVDKI